jgi:integrase
LPPSSTPPTSTPEELRRRQLAALTAWVVAGARVQPVVLALEDLHWADPSTLDFLRGIAERGAPPGGMAADRFARAAVRVALRQVVERTSPALVAWLSTHDRLEPGELNDSIGDHPCTAIRSGGEDVVMPIDLEKWCRQKEIARAGVAAKFTFPVHSHMLRHACGFKLANDGHDTRAIQAYLGHRSIMSTVRYTALTPNRFKHFWKD